MNWIPLFSSVRIGFRHYCIAACLAAVMLAIGSYRLIPGVCGVFHDDGVYTATARSLAEGHGYRLINLPGEPEQTIYPPLYPLLLAAIWKGWPSFPENLVALQSFTLVCGSLFIAFSYLYMVRFGYASSTPAAVSSFLCATTPLLLYISTLTLSETPFALLLVLALWQLELGIARSDGSRPKELFLGTALALPFLCRTAGLAILFAGIGLLLWKRRKIRWVVLGLLATAAPWTLWSSRQRAHDS